MTYKRTITEEITIKELFNRLNVEDKENALEQIKFPLKVKSPYGYNQIVTAFRTEKQKTVTSYFKNNKTLKTSEHHLLKVNGEWKKVKDIEETDIIETEYGTTSIKRKHIGKEEILYDISVKDTHCYYSNGILSHNSWLLARIGAEAMRQGKNVMHFTLELNENYVGLRYDSCFTGIDFQDVRNNVEKVREIINSIPGKLFIKYFPIKTVSANSLKMHMERVQMLTGVKIDMLIVDYADLLVPMVSNKNANSYSEMGSVYEELRTVAGETGVVCWSCSQSNRQGNEEKIIQAHNVADSYRKIMTGDFVLSLSRRMEDKQQATGRIHVLKNRFGADGMTFPIKFNASNGQVDIFDPTTEEGMDLINKINNAENNSEKNMKKDLRNKWNRFSKEEEENE